MTGNRGPGYVFCIRVGGWPQPVFRHVALADPADPQVVSDALACLDRAYPVAPRLLDHDTHRRLFEAWPVAVSDVLEKWNHLADKANL